MVTNLRDVQEFLKNNQSRLWVNYFEKVINYLKLQWKSLNQNTIIITLHLSKVINYITITLQLI